jgi:hypothetical protein
MPWLWSTVVAMAPSLAWKKLGQPQPLSNLVSEVNSSLPGAIVRAAAELVVERAAPGPFGGVLAQHGELVAVELLAPFRLGLLHRVFALVVHPELPRLGPEDGVPPDR